MDVLAVAEVAVLLWLRRRRRRHRKRIWVREVNSRRPEFGSLGHLFTDLANNPEKFFDFFRITTEQFKMLLELIGSSIRKQNTNYRLAIRPEERLAIFLRHVATGDSFASIGLQFRIGKSTVHRIVKETSNAIWKVLQPQYMPVPDHLQWKEIARGFFERCSVPNCLGSVGGMHCQMKGPSTAGSLFHHYKEYHSIVLMAIVDAKCRFTLIDVAAYGRNSDSIVFSHSNMGRSFLSGHLDIPQPSEILHTDIKVPFYLIGDESFPLEPNIMRPYPPKDLDCSRKVFNYRMSRARRTVECAFGLLTQKFGVLKRPMETSTEVSEAIVKSICVLHNFIHHEDSMNFGGDNDDAIDDHSQEMRILSPTRSTRPTAEAMSVRDTLREYFISPGGAVEQQDRMIH